MLAQLVVQAGFCYRCDWALPAKLLVEPLSTKTSVEKKAQIRKIPTRCLSYNGKHCSKVIATSRCWQQRWWPKCHRGSSSSFCRRRRRRCCCSSRKRPRPAGGASNSLFDQQEFPGRDTSGDYHRTNAQLPPLLSPGRPSNDVTLLPSHLFVPELRLLPCQCLCQQPCRMNLFRFLRCGFRMVLPCPRAGPLPV